MCAQKGRIFLKVKTQKHSTLLTYRCHVLLFLTMSFHMNVVKKHYAQFINYYHYYYCFHEFLTDVSSSFQYPLDTLRNALDYPRTILYCYQQINCFFFIPNNI